MPHVVLPSMLQKGKLRYREATRLKLSVNLSTDIQALAPVFFFEGRSLSQGF